ncbi:MAG: DUF938 domain-containing protein [Deltaproteobacteria bacterium]|nr:MAG: DUF938 domain-containing protein [Deltaproteobacteria bacterium]
MKEIAPAAERNKEPIREVLAEVLPATGLVLEVASGTGQHAVHFAAAFPQIVWQPSDVDARALASIRAHAADAALPNLREPIYLDAAADTWPVAAAGAVVSINMIHIAPWRCCVGLVAGAARVLPEGGPLVLYGPFRVDGAFNAPSNAEFDASLRRMDPEWGVRELRDVETEAAARGLVLDRVVDMPANNYTVVFRKRRPATGPRP